MRLKDWQWDVASGLVIIGAATVLVAVVAMLVFIARHVRWV